MKVLSLILLCALSLNVYAVDSSRVTALMKGKLTAHKIHARFSSANAPQTPIRQAIAKYKVVKITATQNPDGSYTYTPSDVCAVAATINVYDDRATGEVDLPSSDIIRASCHSTVNGSPVSIDLGGEVFLYTIGWFGTTQDAKFALPTVSWTASSPGQSASIFDGEIAGSADVMAKSYLVNYGPQNNSSCTVDPKGNETCTPMELETFQVAVDIEDAP